MASVTNERSDGRERAGAMVRRYAFYAMGVCGGCGARSRPAVGARSLV